MCLPALPEPSCALACRTSPPRHARHRHLYLQTLEKCYLFEGCKLRFFDQLLSKAKIEILMPDVRRRAALIDSQSVCCCFACTLGQAVHGRDMLHMS